MHIILKIWNDILISNLFNFILMLLFLGWIIKKFKIADVLEAGRKSVEDRITSAKLKKENAVNELFEVQEHGIDVQKESLDIINKSAKNAVLVGEKLVEDALNQSKTFSESTKKAISTSAEKIRINLTNDTAAKALNIAKLHIEKQLENDRSLHMKYINESIDSLKEVDL